MSLLYQLMAKLAQKVYVNITAILTSLRYKYVDKLPRTPRQQALDLAKPKSLLASRLLPI